MATYTDPTTIIPTGGPKKIELGALLGLVAGVIAVLTAVLFFYANYTAKNEATSVESDIATVKTEVSALDKVSQSVQQITSEAVNLHTIFDNQVRWETVVNNIQKHLYKGMAITSFQLSDSSTFTFKGYTPSYIDYAKIYRSLTDAEGQKYFTNVRPSAVEKTKGTDGSEVVSFVFTATLTPEIMGVVPKVPTSTAQ